MKRFEDEILKLVILPKIVAVTRTEEGSKYTTLLDLHAGFRDTYDCAVSFPKFKEWCTKLEFKPKVTTAWTHPPGGPELDAVNGPDFPLEPEDAEFDNETERDFTRPQGDPRTMSQMLHPDRPQPPLWDTTTAESEK